MQNSSKVSVSKILKTLHGMYLPMVKKLLKSFSLSMDIEGENNALMAKAMANLTKKPLVRNATRGPTQCKIGLYKSRYIPLNRPMLGNFTCWNTAFIQRCKIITVQN